MPLAIALVTIGAHAAPNEVIRLDYAAPSGCPSAETFLDQVRARSPRIRSGDGSERARTLVVRITSQNHRTTGRLTVREVDGSEAERSVVGDRCADVASGLALIAALAVDPTAGTSASPTGTAPPSLPAPPSRGGAAEPSPIGPDAAPSAPPPEKPPAEPPTPEAPARTSGATAARDGAPASDVGRPHWQLAFGAHGAVASGALPGVLVTAPVFFEIARPSSAIAAPAVRMRFERAGSGVVESGAGSAEFTWTAGSLDLCPMAWSRGAVRLTPCLRTEVGALEAAGVNVQPARTGVRPWWSLGVVARGRFTVYGPLFVEIEGALLGAVVRDRFFLEPGGTVFRPSLLGGSAGVGAGLAIW